MAKPIPMTRDPQRRLLLAMVAVVIGAMLAMGGAAEKAEAQTFTVIGKADTAGTCPTISTCAGLRQAINSANSTPGLDTITFNIATATPHVFEPATALPTITEQVIIDGFCGSCDGALANSAALFQPINASYTIIVDGPGAGGASGFVINSPTAVTLKGMVIRNFSGPAIRIDQGTGHLIRGLFMGTNNVGSAVDGDTTSSHIFFNGTATNVVIGGSNPADRNLLSGKNGSGGVAINAGAIASNPVDLTIQGNYIGTNAVGNATIGNQTGITHSDPGLILGGSATGQGNLISGNQIGVSFGPGATATILGNRIGTNAAGTLNVADGTGISGELLNSVIGSTAAGGRNVISGNTNGISLIDSANVDIVNNYIGISADGNTAVPNKLAGVRLQSVSNIDVGLAGANGGNRFGGSDGTITSQAGISMADTWTDVRVTNNTFGIAANGSDVGIRLACISGSGTGTNVAITNNVIANCGSSGISLSADALTGLDVKGNRIGVDANGNPAGNVGSGILVSNTSGIIGGPNPADANIIAFNQLDGVSVNLASNVTITRNRIFQNGGTSQNIGIDLAGNGTPSNDNLDPDTGPNGILNYPEIQTEPYINGDEVHVTFLLRSLASTSFKVEVFRGDQCVSAGAQGANFVTEFTPDATSASGFHAFVAVLEGVAYGEFISATATDPDGNTSEFTPSCHPVRRPTADVTCDFAVTAEDGLAVLNRLAGLTAGPQAEECADEPLPSPADVDSSATEDVFDAVLVMQTVAGLRDLAGNPIAP